jgi:tetratricopeptide (TPR) repeat protein
MRTWLTVLVVLVNAGGAGRLPGDDPPQPRPPWQRLLQGAEAKMVELQGRVEQLQGAGKWDEALRAAEELLQLRQKVQGKDHWQAVDARWQTMALRAVARQGKEGQQEYAGLPALEREADALLARGRPREAEALRRKALEVRRKVLGAEHPDIAYSYDKLAFTFASQGKYAAAEEACRKALAIRRTALGEEHPDTATSYNGLGYNLNAQGKYAAAEESLRKGLAIRLGVFGEKHPYTAQSCNSLGKNLDAQGKYAAAEELFRKALAISVELYGEQHLGTALGYKSLAGNLTARGQYATAETFYRKALAIRLALLGEEHTDTASGYNALAGNLYYQGKYAEAEEGFRKALDIYRKVRGEEHPDTAQSYNDLAVNLDAQGKYAEAAEGYRKALDIYRKVLGEEHPDTANCYNHVVGILNAQGRYPEAEEGIRKALEIHRKVFGEKHPDTAASYLNLAWNLQAQGRYAEAEAGCRKALEIYRKVLGEEHPDTALSCNNLAAYLKAQGKYQEAGDFYRKALAARLEVLGAEHLRTASSYHNLADNFNAQGNYPEAERHFLRAAHSFATARLRVAHSGLERASITGERSPLPALAAVLARNGKPALAWQRFEESLSRGTWDDLSARLRRPAAEQARQAALIARLDRLDLLLKNAVAIKDETTQQREQREELLGQRRKGQEELDGFVAHLEKTYGPAAGRAFDPRAIQAALSDDTALVGWIDLKAAGPKAADPNGEHWAFLLRSQGEPICVRLSGSGAAGAWTGEDTGLAADLRTEVQDRRDGWQRLALRLSQQRLGPLAEHLAAHDSLPAVKHLIVLPSVLLAGVPVELLGEGYTVSYAHSGTLFAHLRSQPKVKTQGLFALADPVFQVPTAPRKEKPLPPGGVLLTVVQPGSNGALGGLRPNDVLLKYGDTDLKGPHDLKPEPPSEDPGRRIIVKLWRDGKVLDLRVRPGKLGMMIADKPAPEALREQRRLDSRLASRGGEWRELPGSRVEVTSITHLFGTSPPPLVLTDSEASEQKLHELAQSGELKKYRYLHLATHGDVDDVFPLRSAVILSRDALPDVGKQLLEGKPVFDGRLTAEEALRQWHLNCDLVTLSACQTALGKYERGEGYVGFAQALTLCGSRSVCLSLWQVDDAATALLMQRFYANLLGKREGLQAPLPKAEALAEAKRWLRTLTREQALKHAAAVYQGIERSKGRPKLPGLPALPERVPEDKGDCPYAHPYYWAAFVLIGDPD